MQARKRYDEAERAGRRIALEAVDAGVPQSRVADALGVSRMTMWRWLRADEHREERSGAADTARSTTAHGGHHAQHAAA